MVATNNAQVGDTGRHLDLPKLGFCVFYHTFQRMNLHVARGLARQMLLPSLKARDHARNLETYTPTHMITHTPV